MYARKSDRLKFSEPESLRLIGLIIFGISISIAALWLPKQCVIICVFNTVAIAAYSAKLSSHWTTKNITMSIISATPILIGWQAGTITHDIVFWGIPIASVAHLAREIIRDVQDIKANEGKRITLPIRFSETSALYISGILLLIATVVVILFMRFISGTLQNVMASLSALLFLYTATKLFIFKKPSHCPTLINASISCIILAVWYTI
jgi:4-hydroxybenzoate polyprenyltransferase